MSGAEGTIEAVYAAARRQAAGVSALPRVSVRGAACILWRRRRGGTEAYLVQRAASLTFLGGFWSFPGGRIDAADGDGDAAYVRAAVRELGEETGLDIAPERLVPAGHFVAPSWASTAIEARYFLIEADDADPDFAASGGELCAGVWLAPEEALAKWKTGEWLVSPPVVQALEVLAEGGGATELRAAALRQAQDERLKVRGWQIAGGVWACPLATPTLPPATHTNCYLMGDDELLVIDPGASDAAELVALDGALGELKKAGRRPVAVALTHHHADHTGGIAHLAEHWQLPIWAHAETAARINLPVARTLEGGETIALGDRRLSVIYTPGHAPGHLCFVDETMRFAAVGDMVAGIGTILIDPSEGDMAAYLDSLAALETLSLRVLLPAHGPPIAEPAAKLAAYVRHRLWREAKILAALTARSPATATELVTVAYDDTPVMLHGLAERSLVAHLEKLAAEGRAARDGSTWTRITG